MFLCHRIRRARTHAGLTQATLARRIGVQRSAVTQWERWGGTSPSVAHLAEIAAQTGVRFEWLATGRGECAPEEGEFDAAVMLDDYARDALESRLLDSMRRVSPQKREALVQMIEAFAH